MNGARWLALALLGGVWPPATVMAQEEEPLLGRPSPIRPPEEAAVTIELAAGDRLRQQPRPDSAVIEILDSPLTLPVIERRGSWVKVRFGSWQGWVQPGGSPETTTQILEMGPEPDRQRLDRALRLFGREIEPREVGPFTLYSDVDDRGLRDFLAALAEHLVDAYSRRYGLDPRPVTGTVIVLFAQEEHYRRFEAAEERIATAHSQGYTSEGLSILFAGRQPADTIASVLVHELTHLLNRGTFPAQIPPWLEEGMAQDLAFCRFDDDGTIHLGSVSTIDTSIDTLIDSWNSPSHIPVANLLSLDWPTFTRFDGRPLRYAASAYLIRFFLDGQERELRDGFRRYLSQLTGSEMPDGVSLTAALGVEAQRLERGFYRFLEQRASLD